MTIEIAAQLTSFGFCLLWYGFVFSNIVMTTVGGVLMGAGVVMGLGIADD